MKLCDYLDPALVWVFPDVESRDALLCTLSEKVAAKVESVDKETLLKAILEREAKASTATPEHVALPHAMLEGIERSYVAATIVEAGVDFEGKHGKDVDLIFVLVGPKDRAWEHVRILARIARVCHSPGALQRIRLASDSQELFDVLMKEDGRHV